MTDISTEIVKAGKAALLNDDILNHLLDELNGDSRRNRQNAAAALNVVAKEDPERVAKNADDFVEALDRDEARTRWESLEVLTRIVPVNSRVCDKAVDGAESSLFDEDSGPVRLAAMRFLCKLGGTTEKRSERVWALIDEGIQCYHGDIEFDDMLTALTEFSTGALAPEVKKAFADRMRFDAEHGRGSLRHRAQAIVENLEA